jgi:hypothetical protein
MNKWIIFVVGVVGAFGAAYQASGGQILPAVIAAVSYATGHLMTSPLSPAPVYPPQPPNSGAPKP